MLSFKEWLQESYKNLILTDDDMKLKEKYKDEVYELLKKAYEKIGGVKGNGFNSPDDMVKNIPFWKLNIKNGKVVFVAMYKDKFGRKLVALGTDFSTEGKKTYKDFIQQELISGRSWGEISDDLLKSIMRNYPDLLNNVKMKSKDAKEILKRLGDDAEIVDDYFYKREIGGEKHTKLAFGKLGNKIN